MGRVTLETNRSPREDEDFEKGRQSATDFAGEVSEANHGQYGTNIAETGGLDIRDYV